jgi:serine/threonine-protein kinase
MGADISTGLPATAIGRFRLVRRAGVGASGEVFLAIDPVARCPVALKLHLPAVGDDRPALQQRFESEARALGGLQHPDIVAVYEAGHWRDRPWIAMEWLPGHDLSRYASKSRLLPEDLALQIVERVARALAGAHRQGIVHRDLKPGNVRVHLADRRVKLADFGLARMPDAAQTATGVVLGSPGYMAPEQLAGAPASPRADLYALGVVLFELLTARRPHESTSLGDLLRQVASQPAPDLRTLRPDLPPALGAEVARLLAKDPEGRHPDGDAVGDALARARLHIGRGRVPG